MEYSHEILSLFNASSFPSQSSQEWMQPGSSVTIVADLENDDGLDESGFPASNKALGNHNGTTDSLNSCLSVNRRAPSFYGPSLNHLEPISHSLNLHNMSSPVAYAHHTQTQIQQQQHPHSHHPSFLISADDTSASESHYTPDMDRRSSDYFPHYSGHQVQHGSPLDLFHMTSQRCSPAKPRAPSSSSSTRRSSSHTDLSPAVSMVTAEEYPNYTTSSPLKVNYNLNVLPRKNTFCSYLGRLQNPRYCAGARHNYEIVRGIASGSTTRPPFSESSEEVEYVPVELKVTGASVEEINEMPWNYEEQQDGRRIIRMERRQQGHVVMAHFSVVGSALEHPVPERAPPNVAVVEVSCLNYVSNVGTKVARVEDMVKSEEGEVREEVVMREHNDYFEGEDDSNVIRYSITSVEVVNIIEALIGSTTMSSSLLRKEKGRIRSNLMPFWSKKPLSSKKSQNPSEKSDPRTDFARRIMRYKARKPRGFDKDVRVLAWDRLVPALHRAMQCYYAEVPCIDIVPSSENSSRAE